MKSIIAVSVLAASLVACATSKAIQEPSGGEAFSIKCSNAALDACHEEAAKVCPRGYTMVDRQAGANAAMAASGSMIMTVRDPNTMLIKCKE